VKEEYPAINRKSVNILIDFSTSYVYEQALSCLTSIKSKDRNRLILDEDEFLASLSKVGARNKHLYIQKQTQVSQ
jgi:hypothetical protein